MFAQVEKRLRVLELVDVRWWNASAEYGVHLAFGLHRRGHRVIVVGRRNSPPVCRAQQLGLPFRAINMTGHNPCTLLSSLFGLMRLIRRERIEVINAHRSEGHLFAVLASLLLGGKVAVVRTRGDVRPPKGHWLNGILHHCLTDVVVLPTEAMRKPVQERFGRPLKLVSVIPPGVDLERFPPDISPEEGRGALGWPKKGPLVGILGRFSPVKGHEIFLRAAHMVLREFSQARFAIVGHEAQMKTSDLKAFAKRLGIAQRVRFAGFVPQVPPVIAAFDVAVVASVGSEVICRVALEHMAMARPVVGTRVNAIPEVVIDGSTGLLVPPGDPQAMGEAILSLLQSPQKARALGRAGRRRVEEEFTMGHLIHRTEAVYRKAILGRQGGELQTCRPLRSLKREADEISPGQMDPKGH